jgi:hypothetical protein
MAARLSIDPDHCAIGESDARSGVEWQVIVPNRFSDPLKGLDLPSTPSESCLAMGAGKSAFGIVDQFR